MEYNLVEMWLRKDPIRWISGALAGLFAGLVALGVAMSLASSGGYEPSFPIKLIGTILLGPSATEMGVGSSAVFAGLALFEGLCLFLGVVFSHFTGSNSLAALVPMGLVWGTFSWIFIWNLFMQSFHSIFAAQISSAVVLPVCLAFGIALSVVALFDRVLRGSSSS